MPGLRALFSLEGRAAIPLMWAVTVPFLLLGIVRGQLSAQGAVGFAAVAMVAQFVVLWPAVVAVPVKRFHDMGRSGKWSILFWGGAAFSMVFLWMDLSMKAPLLDMTARQAFGDPGTYVEGILQLNAARPTDATPLKPLGGVGMGGVSLAMIFLAIQFGWLHIVPGNPGDNRFGPPVATTGDDQTTG